MSGYRGWKLLALLTTVAIAATGLVTSAASAGGQQNGVWVRSDARVVGGTPTFDEFDPQFGSTGGIVNYNIAANPATSTAAGSLQATVIWGNDLPATITADQQVPLTASVLFTSVNYDGDLSLTIQALAYLGTTYVGLGGEQRVSCTSGVSCTLQDPRAFDLSFSLGAGTQDGETRVLRWSIQNCGAACDVEWTYTWDADGSAGGGTSSCSARATSALSTRALFVGGGIPDGLICRLRTVAPGKTKTAIAPLSKRQKVQRVEVTQDTLAAIELMVGFHETPAQRKLKKLTKVRKKLETNCYAVTSSVIVRDGIQHLLTSNDLGLSSVKTPRARALGVACAVLLSKLQKRIEKIARDALVGLRSTEATAGAATGCQVGVFRLRVERRGAKNVVRLVTKGAKPRLNVSCKRIDDGSSTRQTTRVIVKRRGKGTLRKAVGKKLKLNLHRSSKAQNSSAGGKIAIAFP
ncbi:MAG: hypothetical protein ACR2OD_03425 [Gaiellaceae bacterium]